MSYPYPQDRHRDRQEKGDQPYADAKQAMAQERASEQNEVTQPAPGASEQVNPNEVSPDMVERLRHVQQEVAARSHGGPDEFGDDAESDQQ